MSKLNELKKLRDKLQIEIYGKENYPKDAPSVIITNHNRLMDIIYLPLITDENIISLISARLVYKQDKDRLKYINKYLNAFPIEAHGGNVYSDLCIQNASSFINNNLSLSIFPEGAYIDDIKHVYKGRTGAARILFNALNNGSYAYFLPVSIEIKSENQDLDNYIPSLNDTVTININEPIIPDEYFYSFVTSCSREDRNKILHNITDDGMRIIAKSLNREYVDRYIELYQKGNVIFQDGTTIDKEKAQNKIYIERYDSNLKKLYLNLINDLQR